VFVVSKLLAKCVRQPSKPPHAHAHRQIMALGIACTDETLA
jgi:hypothetical protein